MTHEDKDLLLKDLSARLPYGVKMNHIAENEHSPKTLIGVAKDMITLQGLGGYEFVDVDHYKPYLFLLSSMTEEQKNDCPINETNLNIMKANIGYGIIEMPWRLSYLFVDWCNKNHFDYRGLIYMGLANDATGKNIY